ncbi:MAG: sigma-70 family RNA polymerase sigma factor [Myxococcaceae bacterium]|jgi:RNA polymerase sigma-70 factor (ECF subfamily)|nr:sigma-70 family RNA polymerase sigma factor [Myxococcaceae bacterium]
MTADSTQPWLDEVRRARRGDSSAFAALVRGLQRPVFGLCLRLLRSEAEATEVAQETFLRAYQHLERFDETRPFDLWVLTIARNLCLDILRRRQKVQTEDVEPHAPTLASHEPTSEELAMANQQRRSLEDAMATLSDDDREVLALYYVQKRTTKEIAVIMGVAPGTIMARLFRAREKLRTRMTQAEQGAA